jgi:hypothetical protein
MEIYSVSKNSKNKDSPSKKGPKSNSIDFSFMGSIGHLGTQPSGRGSNTQYSNFHKTMMTNNTQNNKNTLLSLNNTNYFKNTKNSSEPKVVKFSESTKFNTSLFDSTRKSSSTNLQLKLGSNFGSILGTNIPRLSNNTLKLDKSNHTNNFNNSTNFNNTTINMNSSLSMIHSMKNYKSSNNLSLSRQSSSLVDEKYLIKDTQLPYDEYVNQQNTIMKDYKYEGLSTGKLNDKSKLHDNESSHRNRKSISQDMINSSDINNLNNLKRNSISNSSKFHNPNYNSEHILLKHHASDETMIKISVNDEEFRSPINSQGILEKNNIIYHSMLVNTKERICKKNLEMLNKINFLKTSKQLFSKVKVTSILPKAELLQNNPTIQTPVININVNNNVNMDKSDSPDTRSPSIARISLQPTNLISYNQENATTQMYGYYLYSKNDFPEGREQFVWVNESNIFLLFGGIVSNKTNYIWSFDPANVEWWKINYDNMQVSLRYGHTGVLHQRKLYVFGGKTKMQNFYVMPDLEIFNLEDRTWSCPVLYTKSTLKMRRNHIAKAIGQHMLIHGGISEEEEYLGDVYLLQFSPLKWVSVNLNTETEIPTLAWHACCLVLPSEQMFSPKLNIYKLPEVGTARRLCKIRERGLYLFGGKSSEDQLRNDLWLLRIGRKPLEWVKINTNGMPPSPRCAHTMNFYEEGNFIIVHGGRNDTSNDSFALNDTYLLELGRFDWIKVNMYFDHRQTIVYDRCSHCSVVYGKYILIAKSRLEIYII